MGSTRPTRHHLPTPSSAPHPRSALRANFASPQVSLTPLRLFLKHPPGRHGSHHRPQRRDGQRSLQHPHLGRRQACRGISALYAGVIAARTHDGPAARRPRPPRRRSARVSRFHAHRRRIYERLCYHHSHVASEWGVSQGLVAVGPLRPSSRAGRRWPSSLASASVSRRTAAGRAATCKTRSPTSSRSAPR